MIRALKRAGFVEHRGAKHLMLFHPDDETRHSTIPNSKTLAPGTLRAILRQCRISPEAFARLYRSGKSN